MLAQYGVGRPGLAGDWATSYDDADAPYTPAWHESITPPQLTKALTSQLNVDSTPLIRP